jgi:hypothetical protein
MPTILAGCEALLFTNVRRTTQVRQLVLRSNAAGLLLALAVMAATASSLRGADTPARAEAPDLSLVPGDTTAFVTARVAGIVNKLGLKDARGLAAVGYPLAFPGLRPADLERVTVLFMTPSDVVVVCRTAKPYDRGALLKVIAPDAKAVKRGDRVFHVSAAGDAVHFADDRVVVCGPDQLVAEVVGKRGPEGKTRLGDAVRQAADHDVFAWSRAADPEEAPPKAAGSAVSASRRRRAVTSYKPSGGGPGPLASLNDLLPNSGALAVYGDFPVPAGVEAADAFLDLGDKTVLGAHLYFADESSAEAGAKLMRVGRDAARAMLLMVQTELSALDCVPDLVGAGEADAAGIADLAPGILSIVRPLEKALDRATIEADGTTVPVVVRLPVNAKKVRTALVAALTMAARCGETGGDGIPVLPCRAWRQATPAGKAPVCTPSGCPMVPSVCPGAPAYWNQPMPFVPGPTGVMPPPPPGPPGFPPQLATPAPPGLIGSPSSILGTSSAMLPLATPAMPAVTTIAAPVAPAAAVKLTVANVAKEPALLFAEAEQGKLVFHRKIPAGEAVDVETTTGKRWVAVFADNPAGETHVATAGGTAWLLRPAGREPMKAATAVNAPSLSR